MTTVIQTGRWRHDFGPAAGGLTPPPAIPPEPTWWATAPVSLGDRDVWTNVTLRQGTRLSGHLEFDGAAERPAADRLRLSHGDVRTSGRPERHPSASSHSNARWSKRPGSSKPINCRRKLCHPGRGPPGLDDSKRHRERKDASDSPFDLTDDEIPNIVVTFTDKITELSGSVRNTKGPDRRAQCCCSPRLRRCGSITDLPHDDSAQPELRRWRVPLRGDCRGRLSSSIAVPGGAPTDWLDPRYFSETGSRGDSIDGCRG